MTSVGAAAGDLRLRAVEPSDELVATYQQRGWWDGETLQTLLTAGLARAGNVRFAVHSAERPFDGTMAQVAARADRFKNAILRLGLGPRDVVAFQLPNWMEAGVAFWGLTAAGVTLVPIPHFYGAREVTHILKETGASTLIVPDRFRSRDYLDEVEAMRTELPGLQRVIVVGDRRLPTWASSFDSLQDGTAPERVAMTARPDAPAVVGYTSGTAAMPKGAILTHRALAFEARHHIGMAYQPTRPVLNGSPVTHMAGMLVAFLVPAVQRQPIHLIDQWDPTVVLATMRSEGLTAGWGAAVFLTSLIDHPSTDARDLALIEHVILGGSPVPAALVDRAEHLGITVGRGYGCTEQPTVTFTNRSDPLEARRSTNGRPLVGVEIKVVDESGAPVTGGAPGEILVRGPDRFSGYLDAAATRPAIDADGWFLTGDIGLVDDNGRLRITDRIKDIIIRGGENLSAAEIEEVLLGMPGIAEVAVVAAPDPVYGERACAFVRMVPGASQPDLEDVRRHLGGTGLARPKWPELVRHGDDLPRTPSGKIRKAVLRDRLRAEAAAPTLSAGSAPA